MLLTSIAKPLMTTETQSWISALKPRLPPRSLSDTFCTFASVSLGVVLGSSHCLHQSLLLKNIYKSVTTNSHSLLPLLPMPLLANVSFAQSYVSV